MRIKKIIVSVFTVLLLGTAMSVPVSAAKTTPTPNFGYVDILVNEESGLIFETRTAAVDGRPAGTAFEAETCYSQAFVNEPAMIRIIRRLQQCVPHCAALILRRIHGHRFWIFRLVLTNPQRQIIRLPLIFQKKGRTGIYTSILMEHLPVQCIIKSSRREQRKIPDN